MMSLKKSLENLGTSRISMWLMRRRIKKILKQDPSAASQIQSELDDARTKGHIKSRPYYELSQYIEYLNPANRNQAEWGYKPDSATVIADDAAEGGQEATRIADNADDTVDETELPTEVSMLYEDAATEISELNEDAATEVSILGEDAATEISAPNEDAATEISALNEDAATEISEVAPDAITDISHQVSDTSEGELDFDFSAGSVVDVDISQDAISADVSGTDVTSPRDGTIGDLSGGYTEGSIIKQRFKLEKVLGVGGMGKVYKALDLLKEEARDKKPHVAVKLLNDDFKGHPEAFISLQRESSRQQKLAHPNIATIYDFDRVGGRGTPVFITMELMEGMELKDYIRKKVKPQGGLPFKQAYEIVQQLGAGLTYAHERNLVHSDFKPGNAFLCNDGTVKTLDFGIARAVKNPVTGETEKTLFDPGKLGALTPAYASFEMLDGAEPDTRDDTYALGCTAYELLTGQHPFKKLPADKAAKKKLTPPYIKSLNKKQNRALRRAVAFRRANRSPTVAHFVDELAGKATWHKNPVVIAASILLIISGILFNPARDYMQAQELQKMIAYINTDTSVNIPQQLETIRNLESQDKNQVVEGTKNVLQSYFADNITQILESSDDFHYKKAESALSQISEFYPESIFLQEQRDRTDATKDQLISKYNSEYIEALRKPESIAQTKVILEKLANVDPQHPLLTDTRPATAYRIIANQAYKQKELEKALSYARSGLEYAPDNIRLQDLQTTIEQEITLASLERELDGITQATTLNELLQQGDTITNLALLAADNSMVRFLRNVMQSRMEEKIAEVNTTGTRQDAEQAVQTYTPLLSALHLNDELLRLRMAQLSNDEQKNLISVIATENVQTAEQLLQNAGIDDPIWESDLFNALDTLRNLDTGNEQYLEQAESFSYNAIQLFADRVQQLLEDKRFDVAEALAERARRFSPESELVASTFSEIALAQEEDERQERVKSYKNDLKAFAAGNNITDAMATLENLRNDLSENDIYLTVEAIPTVAQTFGRVAVSRAEAKDFESALTLARKGYELDPTDSLLKNYADTYEAEVNITELISMFGDPSVESLPNDVRVKVTQIRTAGENSGRFAEFRKEAVRLLQEKIEALQGNNKNAAAVLARTSADLFPTDRSLTKLSSTMEVKSWEDYARANQLTSLGRLTEATALRDQAKAEFSNHPQYERFVKILEQKITEANILYQTYLDTKKEAGNDYAALLTADSLLSNVTSRWVDNPTFTQESETLAAELVAQRPVKPAPRTTIVRASETNINDLMETAATQVEWAPVASDAECTMRIAGYGRRAKAVCYDILHRSPNSSSGGARGPDLVVVPLSDGLNKAFAIGKYEISIADWAKYCLLSDDCELSNAEADPKNPARFEPKTNISLEEAKKYTQWLSERTGKTYRLPNPGEWEYAANSGGKQPHRDYNCRIAIGDKLIKGSGTISVKSGRSNAWGLKNYVGNIQEWVLDDINIAARGGSFQDAHSKCEIALSRDHNGNADEATGFRVLREEVFEQSTAKEKTKNSRTSS